MFTARAFLQPRSAVIGVNRRISTAAAAGEKSRGTVKWFSTAKGFGFITPEAGGDDLFVHQTDIVTEGFRSLADGEEVEYAVAKGDKGLSKAISVTGPGGAAPKGAPRQESYNSYNNNDRSYNDRY